MNGFSKVPAWVASASMVGCLLGGAAAARTTPFHRIAAPDRSSGPMVYAVNEFGFSVTAFPLSASHNVSPALDIVGSNTKIYEPEGLAVSRQGLVAVSNSQNDVTEYAAGADGNVAPLGTMTCGGPSGAGWSPMQLAFDEGGNLYVQFVGGYHASSGAIEVYPPNQQSGCVVSNQIITGDSTELPGFGGLAVGGGMIYTAYGSAVEVFRTSDNGNVAPRYKIEGSKTGLQNVDALAVDKNGYLYVSNTTDIAVFAPKARKNATPVAVISGPNTQIPQTGYGALSIAVDKHGDIFVGVENASQESSILVFAPGSNANVAPSHVISGKNTGLDWPAELGIRE